MNKQKLKKLTNNQLEKLLNEAEWLDRKLLQEYDERRHDGRIKMGKPMTVQELEGYFRKRREVKERKKAS